MSEHEAGRELDALVAEKVMGFTDNRPSGKSGDMWGIMDWYSPDKPAWVLEVPHYSTDISAAWEVVEKIRPYQFDLGIFNDGWLCKLCAGRDNSRTFSAYGGSHPYDTARGLGFSQMGPALAICLAALKAVESSDV